MNMLQQLLMRRTRMLEATRRRLGAADGPFRVQDVFSADVYTGNGAARSIVNGVNLAAGGALLHRRRNSNAFWNLFDKSRGLTKTMQTNVTNAESSIGNIFTFNADGFGIVGATQNTAAAPYIAYSLKEHPRLFKFTEYTGDAGAGGGVQVVPHGLGVAPGLILFKDLDTFSTDWYDWHRERPDTVYSVLGTSGTVGASLGSSEIFYVDDEEVGISYTSLREAGRWGMWCFAHDEADDGVAICPQYTPNYGTGVGSFEHGWPEGVQFAMRRMTISQYRITDTARSPGWASPQPVLNMQAQTAEASSAVIVSDIGGIITFADGLDGRNEACLLIRGEKPENSLQKMVADLGLGDGLQLILDAGDRNSYPGGTEQKWFDVSGQGHHFQRGTGPSANSEDPTFNGTAGACSDGEFFSLDADAFSSTTDQSWADDFHSSDAEFTLVALWSRPSTTVGSIFQTAAISGPGARFGVLSGGLNVIYDNGSSQATGPGATGADLTPANNVLSFLAIAVNTGVGATVKVNASSQDTTAPNGVATDTPPTSTAYRIASFPPAGTKIAGFIAWRRRLSNAELDALYTAIKVRFPTMP